MDLPAIQSGNCARGMISQRREETVERWLEHRRGGAGVVLKYAGAANRHERGCEQRRKVKASSFGSA
jgi:hypothetical protein